MTFWHFFLSLLKLAIVSLIVGAALTYLNISAADLLARIGMTPERVGELIVLGLRWAVPNVMLGSMIVLPVWFLMFLFRPPRGGG
ncbi:MAG: hypothetical protein JNM13_16750 [Hyphomicrobiaceae bacterium]|nr:hypothetical protein [Hyphomicrobiaceae bacterium]